MIVGGLLISRLGNPLPAQSRHRTTARAARVILFMLLQKYRIKNPSADSGALCS